MEFHVIVGRVLITWSQTGLFIRSNSSWTTKILQVCWLKSCPASRTFPVSSGYSLFLLTSRKSECIVEHQHYLSTNLAEGAATGRVCWHGWLAPFVWGWYRFSQFTQCSFHSQKSTGTRAVKYKPSGNSAHPSTILYERHSWFCKGTRQKHSTAASGICSECSLSLNKSMNVHRLMHTLIPCVYELYDIKAPAVIATFVVGFSNFNILPWTMCSSQLGRARASATLLNWLDSRKLSSVRLPYKLSVGFQISEVLNLESNLPGTCIACGVCEEVQSYTCFVLRYFGPVRDCHLWYVITRAWQIFLYWWFSAWPDEAAVWRAS